jgi:AraC family transcriptional regulator
VSSGFATAIEEDGVVALSARLRGLTLVELRFPPDYAQAPFEPPEPYAGFVLEGAMAKSFRSRTLDLGSGSGFVMPVGATHGARFGPTGTRVIIVKSNGASSRVAGSFERLAEVRGPGLSSVAWRLAAELAASDAAAPLAAEGLSLELLAATARETSPDRRARRPPFWLRSAEELLRAETRRSLGLSELADCVGVHPAHLARAFRAHYGVSVGDYGRRVRIERAAVEIARGERAIVAIAAEAGFADQSHFTRLFTRYIGTTPARYRRELSASSVPS